MTKKDNEKDSDRPHYYSQFWLDVAAGRRIIGAPKEEGETGESEAVATSSARKASRVQEEEIVSPAVETVDQTEAYAEPEEEEFASDTFEGVVDADVPDVDFAEEEEELEPEEEEEEDFFEDEEEEEEEEWGGRSRKKGKPARAAKPAKKPRRETRRGF